VPAAGRYEARGVLTRAFLTASLLVGLLAAPAQAAPNWLPPFTLTPQDLQEPFTTVAVAPDGTTVAAWSRTDGGDVIVEAARRVPGQTFSAPVRLSDSGNDATAPQVGIDAAGNATVAWQESLTSGLRVRVAGLPAGGASFEQTQTLFAAANAAAPAVGVGANGTAVVVFQEGPLGSAVLKAAIREGASGLFSSPQTISDPSGNFYATNGSASADVAVAPDGSAVVAWATFVTADARYLVQTNVRSPNLPFASTGQTRSSTAANASGEHPALAMDAAGNATVAWTDIPDTANPDREVRFAARPAGGGFAPAADASAPAAIAENPDLATTGDGTVIGTWLSGSGSSRRVETAIRAPGAASFGAHQLMLPAAGPSLDPRLAVSPAGDAIVIWPQTDIAGLSAARRTPAGTFGEAQEVVGDSAEPAGTEFLFSNPALAIDDEGNATALWRFDEFRLLTDFYRVQAAGFDAAPPALSASVPPAATSGAPVGMAAAALDRWGPVSVHWAFGDGASGAGDAVSHAFGAAGAFNVTVTATDAVGNATTATRPIAVAAAPLPRIDSSVSSRWGFDRLKRFIFLLRLRVKAPPKGAVAELRCNGRKCPFKRKRVSRIRRNRIDVFKALTTRQRRFRPGQTLQLRITAPGFIGKVVKFRLKRGKIPNGQTLCLPPGAKRPRRTC
jgi:hypothetical protein